MATAFTQVGFRGRNDDGTETTATWKAAANVNWFQKPDTNFRVRFDCSETGTTAATLAGQLQYNKNGAGWNAVNASSTVVRSASSAQVTDGTATTQLISSGTFVAGSIDTVDSLCATTASIAQNAHTELEFCVQIRSVDVAPGDTIQLRVVRSPSTAFGTYTNTPTATVFIFKQPATGALTYTGIALKLKLGIKPATQSLTFTGQALTITNAPAAINKNPGTATLVFTGAAVKLKNTLTPATQALTFTGAAAKLRTSLKPAAQALVYAGASLALRSTLKPATQALAFTGQTLKLQSSLALGTVALVFSGRPLALKSSIKPGTQALIFSGQNLSITNSGGTSIQPGTQALTFTGAALRLRLTIPPSATALTFTGSSLRLKSSLRPATVSMTFAGAALSILNSIPSVPNVAGRATVSHAKKAPSPFSVGQFQKNSSYAALLKNMDSQDPGSVVYIQIFPKQTSVQ